MGFHLLQLPFQTCTFINFKLVTIFFTRYVCNSPFRVGVRYAYIVTFTQIILTYNHSNLISKPERPTFNTINLAVNRYHVT